MGDLILPGELSAGDIVALPGDVDEVVVKAVRLGPGGFVLTVADSGVPHAAERVVTLTAATPTSRRGRVPAF